METNDMTANDPNGNNAISPKNTGGSASGSSGWSAVYDGIIREITEDYIDNFIQNRQNNTPLSDNEVKQIKGELAGQFMQCMACENAIREKGNKLKTPQCLPPASIAALLVKLENVRLLKRLHGTERCNCEVAFYQHEGERAGVYDTDEDVLRRKIRRYNYCITPAEAKAVIQCIREMAPIVEVEKDRDLIAVNNGIFHYGKKTLMPFSPEYVFTSKIAVDYHDGANNTPIHNDKDNTDWDVESWVNDLTEDEEIRRLIWQIIGAAARPNVRWNKVVLPYSQTGNNGKGTLCVLLRNLCGEMNCASVAIEDTEKDFMLETLLTATAVIVDENNTNGFLDKAKNFKSLVTGDTLQINRKYKIPISIRFTGLIVECINFLPRISDQTDSFFRRLLIVPFEKCYTGKERKYIKEDYLNRREVLEYVLYKVLNVMPDYYKFDVPAACDELLAEYKQYNDPVREFANEILPELAWDFPVNTFLYELYVAWHKRSFPTGRPVGKNIFLDRLRVIVGEGSDWEIMPNGSTTRSYTYGYEPLIGEYGLERWTNDTYRGSDTKLRCTPNPDQIPSTAAGIRRVTSGTVAAVAAVDEKPFSAA